jgi:hypothetical protein
MNDKKSFVASLLDLSFSNLVTTKIIKFLYLIAIVLSAITILGFVVGAFSDSVSSGFIMLILSPVVFLLQILFARIWLELIIVVFKIAENTSYLASKESEK